MKKPPDGSLVPADLEYLASSELPAGVALRVPPDHDRYAPDKASPATLSGAASRRLADIARAELPEADSAFVRPDWLNQQAIPRLLVSARYDGRDAFGASRMLARLDLAARRAGAMYRQIMNGDGKKKEWPEPLRTYQGGLHLLDVRLGSVEVLSTVWGALVSVATSSPIAVAGLMSLAWDIGQTGRYVAARWRAGALVHQTDARPSFDASGATEPWSTSQTQNLMPVMNSAIANNQGFEYSLDGRELQVKLTVLPKDD
ncbi:hypothetical protein [Microbacterium candidum]|uniref:Peroxide stress protein YaaA n=1 Tax=Microbacterium candidum TaxID=3041922 RepID=A0ABT7MX60_9MICO|nr:hypothetical protein [Microbacterium sp. ASV49]MDL9979039.1 hypothetical protein [Microbacterium sp. ASV49]